MAKEVKDIEKKINPFDSGVTYPKFLTALGKQSVKDYCKDVLTDEQIEWLEKDLEIFNSNK